MKKPTLPSCAGFSVTSPPNSMHCRVAPRKRTRTFLDRGLSERTRRDQEWLRDNLARLVAYGGDLKAPIRLGGQLPKAMPIFAQGKSISKLRGNRRSRT